jgi:3'(2'), 5'-bisphosphate nucleotidase
MYQNELNLSKQLAKEAGNIIMKIYHKDFAVEKKEDKSPLTIADKKSNMHIVEGIRKHCPQYSILSEELKDDRIRLNNDYCFIVDPLDGTKEFIKRNGQFTVNIALTFKHEVVMGVVYVPVTGSLYYASRGDGAYFNNVNTGIIKRIHVTDKLNNLIWVGSKSHSSEKEESLINSHKELISDTISAGSSIKGCMVASGQADVYYRLGLTSEWDTAAMQCIVEEAGGIFRQMNGSVMLYNRENNLNEKGFYAVNREENIWV